MYILLPVQSVRVREGTLRTACSLSCTVLLHPGSARNDGNVGDSETRREMRVLKKKNEGERKRKKKRKKKRRAKETHGARSDQPKVSGMKNA